MDPKQLFNRIDTLFPVYLEFWKEICKRESPTNDKQRVDVLGAYLQEQAKEHSFQVKVHNEDVSGNALCFTMNPDTAGTPVCLSAHMDTVYPVGTFGETPVRTDETYIYGPGVSDCKGGIAAGFLAMRALSDIGFRSRPVRLILQSDEEVGSSYSQKRTVAFMREMAEGCAAFLNLETHASNRKPLDGAPENAETAVLMRKGIIRYRFHIHGKSAHSSSCSEGISAVAEAAHKILALEEMKDDDALTCNCSMLRGGTAANVVPDECMFTADIRFLNDTQLRKAQTLVQEISQTSFISGSRCEAEIISSRCAMERNERNERLLSKMNAIYSRHGMPILYAAMSKGGSDAADMSAAGLPTVDSIGVTGEKIHSPEERAELASLAACAKRIAIVAMEL